MGLCTVAVPDETFGHQTSGIEGMEAVDAPQQAGEFS